MAYRKFWLENADGNLYHLTDPTKDWFLADPEGLGITINYTSVKLSNSEFINYKDYDLGSVEGELLFYGKTNAKKYDDYFNFLRFLSRTPIYLHYLTPNSATAYRTLVQLTGMEKSQVETDGILHCPISFKRQTLWFSDQLNTITVGGSIEDGKMYELYRPYSYGAISYRNINILNNGMIDAPFTFLIEGSVTDVTYSLSQYGEIFGRGKILGTYDRVYVDSDDLTERIELGLNGSNIPNAVNYQDLTVGSANEIFVTFLKLRAGMNNLNFALPDSFDGTIEVSWRNAYLSV